MKQKNIVTLTMNPAVDISSTVDRVVPEEKLRCDPPVRQPGGGGINVSRALRKLGGASLSLYLSGGRNGEFIHDFLVDEGVETRTQVIHGNVRENVTILEESSGLQYRFGMPGPVFKEREWKDTLGTVRELCVRADYLVASGSLPLNVPVDFYARVGEVAAENGTRFVIDTSNQALEAASREEIFLVKPNRRELGHILGRGDTSSLSRKELIELAAEVIRERPIRAVALSLGPEGAVLVTADTVLEVPSPPVETVSKIGAGDSMLAGSVLSLARGNSLSDAVRFGVAAGTAAVKTPGTELCTREDTEELYRRIKSA
ncbi:MAG: 1-phosphofructokinase family hexose kinase [Spirochaetia bacterium]